jgi:type VI secretion system protein ImpL
LSNPDIPAVTVFDFWSTANRGAAKPKDGELPVVDSAFTKEGKKHIDSFLLELERSIDNGPKFLKGRQAFEDWYKEQRVLAWKTFLAKFPGTENLLSGEVAWRTSLGKIAGPQDPYYKLMDRLNSEFGEEHVDKLPGWLQLSRQLGQVRAQAMGVGVGGEAAKVVGAINTAGGKAIKEFFDGKPAQSKVTFTGDLSAVSAMQQFLTGINSASVEVSTGTGKAMQVAIDFHNFGRDPSIKSSELLNLAENLKSLRKFIGFTGPDEEAVWQLMGAPLQFLLQYTEQQASCALQKEWEAKVDFPLQTVASMDSLVEQLYGAKGSVWAFADGAAKPFLTQNANRFGVVQTLGYSVPFTRDFLPMLNDAAGRRVEQLVMKQRAEMEDQSQKLETEKEQLQIQQSLAQIERVLVDIKQKVESLKAQVLQFSIAAQPTSVNPEAKAKPFQTVLTIQCANGARIINNFNFQVTDTVTIGDRSCGDVSLQIRIDDVVLTKNYAGSKGVVHFLQDFVDGSRHFVVDDFPSSRNRLVALGVNRIGVRYNFEGQDAVVRLSQQLDALDQQEKDKLAEKARLQDQQLRLEQVGMQTKMSSGRRTAKVSVVLPEEIGVCWNTRLSANTAQDSQAMFSEAAAEQLAAPASPTKTSAKAKTKGN